ncbi:transporter substrate-binding domain-containing protein [Desulfovibrio sulfodismutans]|uniref:histidine kinase n=2 Tax=Desulfolutivibrio sulfodismutans TaxID=63561 RepID=A0A7K3NJZ0_9BACT|nr:transporter substrate-binding domain-containing protein [Desulfolutivibrio sulfodismutans]
MSIMASFVPVAALRRVLAVLAVLATVFSGSSLAVADTLPELGLTDEEKAFIEAHPVITFSDSIWEPLAMVENGKYQGIFHDFYEIVSAMTGLAFKFEAQGDSRNFGKVLAALRDKRIDMIDGTGRSAEREKYALFAGPYLRFPLAIVSRDDVMAGSILELQGKRVAVASGSTAYEYVRDNHPDVDLLVVEDPAEALLAVSSGQAQAMLDNLAVVTYGIRKAGLSNLKVSGLTDFAFDIYTLVRDDMPELASILDKALKAIPVWDKAAIMAKWLPLYASGQAAARADAAGGSAGVAGPAPARVTLNRREREFVQNKGSLRYCVDPDWPPIERISETGRFEGMAADVLALLSERLGVETRLVPTASWSQTLETAEKGGCDFIAAAVETPERRRFLDFTSPYLRLPLVVATRADHPFVDGPKALMHDRVGVVRSHATAAILRSKYPSLDVVDMPTEAEGLSQVASGGLGAFVDVLPAVAYRIDKERLTGLKIAGRLEDHLDLSLAVPRGKTEVLSIFQKGISSLAAEELDAIFKKWVAVRFEHGFDYTLVWRVAAGAALVIVLIVWWNRKLTRLNRTIRQAQEELSALLDNSGQGFLSFGVDCRVQPRFSHECLDIFGRDPAGETIQTLLFPDDARACGDFAKNVGRILAEDDDFRRSLYLSLMPASVHLGNRDLEVEYRMSGPGRLMLVLTDVTNARRLESEVEKERGRLANVVAVARDPRDFFQVADSFRDFASTCRTPVAPGETPGEALRRHYRRVHTFKGLFQLFGCRRVSAALHDLESRLSGLNPEQATAASLGGVMRLSPVLAELEADLALLRQTLGDDFFKRRDAVCIGEEAARELEGLAEGLAAALPTPDPRLHALLERARTLRHVDMRELLAVPLGTAVQLAERLGKAVTVPPVSGQAVPVDPDLFGPLARRMVHLVRNAVAHGIEPPQERLRLGKPEAGTVAVSVEKKDGLLCLRVSDDGAGIDPVAVRDKAAALGIAEKDELAAMDGGQVVRLVLAQGLSTADGDAKAAGAAGRGVGLAAVLEAAKRLGGDMDIESRPGRGTTFTVRVPLSATEKGKEQS